WTWSLATLVPLAGLFCSECLLLLTRLEPSWTMPIRGALRHSVLWHLGFWEWTGAAAVFVFLCAAVFLTPSDLSASEACCAPQSARRLGLANRRFEFQKRGQLFICTHDEPLSVVAMGVNNPDRSPSAIYRRNAAPNSTQLC